MKLAFLAVCLRPLFSLVSMFAQDVAFSGLNPEQAAGLNQGFWCIVMFGAILVASLLNFGTIFLFALLLMPADILRAGIGISAWTLETISAVISYGLTFAGTVDATTQAQFLHQGPMGVGYEAVSDMFNIVRAFAGFVACLFIAIVLIRGRHRSYVVAAFFIAYLLLQVFSAISLNVFQPWIIAIHLWVFPVIVVGTQVAAAVWLARAIRRETGRSIWHF